MNAIRRPFSRTRLTEYFRKQSHRATRRIVGPGPVAVSPTTTMAGNPRPRHHGALGIDQTKHPLTTITPPSLALPVSRRRGP
jgi:hypothetical protein